MQKKGAKLNVNFNNIKEAEAPGGNYVVEFNNQKEVLIKQTTEEKETKVEEKKEEAIEPVVDVEIQEKELADMGSIRNQRGTPLIEYHF